MEVVNEKLKRIIEVKAINIILAFKPNHLTIECFLLHFKQTMGSPEIAINICYMT